MNMKVTYIYHSGFSVELKECVLLFDYYKGKLPQWGKGKTIYVFASHKHQDHFNMGIFDLAKQYEKIHFFLGSDIKLSKNYLERNGIPSSLKEKMTNTGKNKGFEKNGIRVRTLRSNDEGVAFIVEAEGRTVYHAGDLNWWTWEGETKEEYQAMTKKFKASMELVRQKLQSMDIPCFDVAFVPLDPRQKERYAMGFDFFMRNIPVKHVFPMHAFGDYSVIGKLMRDELSKDYRDKIINICGQEKRKVKILSPEMRRRVKELLNR